MVISGGMPRAMGIDTNRMGSVMIELRGRDGQILWINSDHIRSVSQVPETVIVFADGKSVMVMESPVEIEAKVVEFRRRCGSSAGKGE